MKRIFALLVLMMCAVLAFSAQAATVAPGDTVSIPISVGASDAFVIRLEVTCDAGIFEYQSISCPGGAANNGKMVKYSISDEPIQAGVFGSVTVKIKDDVESGTYSLSVKVLEAKDTNYQDTTVSAFSGSVTVVAPCKHKTTEENIVKSATCEEDGSKEIVCSACKEVLRTETITAIGHNYGAYVVTTAPTCEKDGVETSTCANCSGTKTQAVAKLNHDMGAYAVTTAPTCEKDGVETSKCSRCDKADTRSIDKLGHDMSAYTQTTAPTCEKNGVETSKCSRCDKKDTKEITKLGHNFSEFKETLAPTCTAEGTRTGYCVRCDKTATEAIPALDHDMGEYTVTTAPTCEKAGAETSKCSRCDKVVTRSIDKLGHDMSEYTVTTAATCEKAGVETSKCSRCDKVVTRAINKLGHDMSEPSITKEATCTENGEKTSKCSRCDKVDTTVITKLGHSFGAYEITKPATCTEKGEKVSKCSRCDEKQTLGIAALGHKFGEWIEEAKATCTANGKKYRECSRCHEREEVVISALGHNAVWKVIKPATSKEEGLRQKICKRCNEVLDEQVIPIRKVVYKTACTAGYKISEFGSLIDNNDAWKMVTPVDLSIEGTTQYPVIAGNVYEIGYVEVTVNHEEGTVTFDLVIEANVVMYTSGLILIKDPSEIERFTIDDYEYYEFPATIEISSLPAEKLLMMVSCQLTIDETKPEPKYYNFKDEAHLALMEALELNLSDEVKETYFPEN